MTTVSERIQGLVASGKISAEEGERLLRANVEPLPSAPWWNPFHRLGGERAALAGLVIAACCVALTRLGVRYDGFLDLHIRSGAPGLTIALVEELMAVVVPAILFWGYALLFDARVRLVDFVGMTAFARLPLGVLSLPLLLLTRLAMGPDGKPHLGAVLLPIAMLALAGLVAHVGLLFLGFKNASGLRGARLATGFVALMFLCEVVSKLVLSRFS